MFDKIYKYMKKMKKKRSLKKAQEEIQRAEEVLKNWKKKNKK